METVIAQPAAAVEEFGKHSCDYCGARMTFPRRSKGQKAECPECGRIIQLGISLPDSLELCRRGAHRVEKLARTRIRALTLYLGWPLFGAGFLALTSSMVAPLLGGDALSRLLSLGLSLLATGVGLALMLESRHPQTYWICSACESRLPGSHTITCGNCAAELE